MNIVNARPTVGATNSSTLVAIEKVPEKIAEGSPKVAMVKRTVVKKKAPIASVERVITQRPRSDVNARKAVSTQQSPAGKPVSKKPSAVGTGPRMQAASSSKTNVASQAVAPKKVSKGKVIRDSVTMPVEDYERLGVLKKKCLTLGIAIKKSELLRAGLATLQRLTNEDLKRVLALVEKIKTGRPAGKEKKSKSGKKVRK